MEEELLQEYVATANNPEYNSDWDIINGKFPELKDYDKTALQEYVATANNPEYESNWELINSKFPEFAKKAQADSTESPSDLAQKESKSDSTKETEAVLSSSTSTEDPTVDRDLQQLALQTPDERIAQVYDTYIAEGKITKSQANVINATIDKQQSGDRGVMETVGALSQGLLMTGTLIPLYTFDTVEDLNKKRRVKNRVDYLSELPADAVQEIHNFAVNRAIALDKSTQNLLGANKMMDEKAKSLVSQIVNMENTIKQIQAKGEPVPEEGVEAYRTAFNELQDMNKNYNLNVDLMESNSEDIADFVDEVSLLKRNFQGLDYYKDVSRLATASLIGGAIEIGASIQEELADNREYRDAEGNVTDPYGNSSQIDIIDLTKFGQEFRAEVGRQQGLLKPATRVGDIESGEQLGVWFGEQVMTQLPILMTLIASGGTTGLTALSVSAGGQKIGQMKDENRLEGKNYSKKEIYFAGLGVGLSEFITERFSLGLINKGKRALTAGMRSAEPIGVGVAKVFTGGLRGAAGEGATEFANSVANNLIDIVGLNKPGHIFKDSVDALASGAAMGMGMAMFPSLVGVGAKAFMPREVQSNVYRKTKRLDDLLTELEEGGETINPDTKKTIDKKVKSLTKEVDKEIKETYDKLSNLSKTDIKTLMDLDTEHTSLMGQVKDIKNNETFSEETKGELLQELKEKTDAIAVAKTSILNKVDNGSKQATQEDTVTKEAVGKEVDGTDAGAKGADKVQGKDGKESGVVDDGKGVQPDSPRDKTREGKNLAKKFGFDDKSDRVRTLIEAVDEIEGSNFFYKNKIDRAKTPEEKAEIVKDLKEKKAELKKLRGELKDEGVKGWWVTEDVFGNKVVDEKVDKPVAKKAPVKKVVKQDVSRDKERTQRIEDLKDKEFENDEKKDEMSERVKNGEAASMNKADYKKFREEQNSLRVKGQKISNEIDKLEAEAKKAAKPVAKKAPLKAKPTVKAPTTVKELLVELEKIGKDVMDKGGKVSTKVRNKAKAVLKDFTEVIDTSVDLGKAVGRISANTVVDPLTDKVLFKPGERITKAKLDKITRPTPVKGAKGKGKAIKKGENSKNLIEQIEVLKEGIKNNQKLTTDNILDLHALTGETGFAIEGERLSEDSTDPTTVQEFESIDLSEPKGADKLLDMLDKWDKGLEQHGKETLGANIPVIIARGAVAVMKIAVLTAKTAAEVLKAGMDYMKNSDWYKGLSTKEKADARKKLVTAISSVNALPPKKIKGRGTPRGKMETKIDAMIAEGKSDAQILDTFKNKKKKMVAKDIIEKKKHLAPEEAAKELEAMYDESQEEMKEKKKYIGFWKKGFRKWARNWTDRQYVPKMLMVKAGLKVVRNYLLTAKGASGYAKFIFDDAYNEIYKGLSEKDLKMLDLTIIGRRFAAIDKNREERGLEPVVHPKHLNRQRIDAALEHLGIVEGTDLWKRSDAYFKTFQGLLTDMEKSGLITKEFRESFFEVNYMPKVYLEFLKTAEQEQSIIEMGLEESSSLASPQVRTMEDGSDAALVTDSMYLLSRSINVRTKAIAMNNTLRSLQREIESQRPKVDALRKKANPTNAEQKTIKYFDELTRRVIYNPIKQTKDGQNKLSKNLDPIYVNKVKKGQKAQSFYIDGVKHQFIMEETFFDAFNDNIRAMFNNTNVREAANLLSLTALVKTVATGNNPTFFLTNTPRDIFFVATFSDAYGQEFLSNIAMVMRDTVLGVRDIVAKNNDYKNFVKYGGMLDYLHMQGTFKGTGEIQQLIKKFISTKNKDKVHVFADLATAKKLQMFSEIGVRMGVFNRVAKKQMKIGKKKVGKFRKSYTEEEYIAKFGQDVMDDVYVTATAAARNTTDFSQGGTWLKDFDAVVPYLNASVQGTRVAMEALYERPIETTSRMIQAAAWGGGASIASSIFFLGKLRDRDKETEEEREMSASELYVHAREGLSQYDKTNYNIIFTGKRNEDGEFEYIRIAKAHFLTPLMAFVENHYVGMIKKANGIDTPDTSWEDIKFALGTNVSPVEANLAGMITRSPLVKSVMTMRTGHDFYRDQDLSHLKGTVPVPVEGHEQKGVENFYKVIGEEFNLSPARMKGAVESFITTPSTSPFIGMLYGGMDYMLAGKETSELSNGFQKNMLKSFVGRIHKSTSQFNRYIDFNKLYEKEFSKIEIDAIKNKGIVKDLTKKIMNKEIDESALEAELVRISKESPMDVERMFNVVKATVLKPEVSPYVWQIKYSKPKQRAIMLVHLFGDGLMGTMKELKKSNRKLAKELFENAINVETLQEYNLLLQKGRKGTK